jgi:hypothetical protein
MRIHWRRAGSSGSEEDGPIFELEISRWVLVGSVFIYVLWMAMETGFSAASVNRLVILVAVVCVAEIGPAFVSWTKRVVRGGAGGQALTGERVGRAEKLVRTSCQLLAREDQERYLDEWIDDLESRRERGEGVWRAAVWIVLRSVLPLTFRSFGSKAIRLITRR